MPLRIIEPHPKYMDTFAAGLKEIKEQKTPYDISLVCHSIEFMEKDFEGYFDFLSARKSLKQPKGRVPSSSLWLMDGERFVGIYDIRHNLNDYLKKTGGHIAYQIIPSARGRGYVKQGLKMVLDWAWKNLRLEAALLSCHQENQASYRAMKAVMLEMGGIERAVIDFEGHQECSVWILTQKSKINEAIVQKLRREKCL